MNPIQTVSHCMPPSSIWIADMLPWNPIQRVSDCHVPPSSIWIADMLPWNPMQGVSRVLLSSIWIADMLPWNPAQAVSHCCVPPSSIWIVDICHVEIPSRQWVTVYLLAQFKLLTCQCCHEISMPQLVSHCVPPSSIWIADILPWNPMQEVSHCVPPSSIWIADMLPWNPIQQVSHCTSLTGLNLNCWHPNSLILFSLYLSSPTYSLCPTSLIGMNFTGEECSGSCGCSIQCKIIFYSFHSLHSSIPNYIGTFFALFHWSDQPYPFSYI